MRLVKQHRVYVEPSAIEVQPVDVDAVLGWRIELGFLEREKVVDQQVDRYGVLARVVLSGSGQEGLGEVEPGYPKGAGRALLVPFL